MRTMPPRYYSLPLRMVWILALLAACNFPARPGGQTPTPEMPAAAILTITPTKTATLRPTATAQDGLNATPTLHPAPTACNDAMTVLLTYDFARSSELAPRLMAAGEPARAGWRLLNSGSCPWDQAYAVTRQDDELSFVIPQRIAPGEWVDVWVDFLAPRQAGVVGLSWQLTNGRGEPVGPPLTVGVEVARNITPAPTLGSGVSLRAYPEQIYPGEKSVVSWQVHDAKAVYFYPVGQNWRTHPVDDQGDFADAPSRTITYELRVVKGDDRVETFRVRVVVLPYEPPNIRLFRAKWEKGIVTQWCVRLEWEVVGQVRMVNIFRNGEALRIDDYKTAARSDCLSTAGLYTYTIQAIGPGGETWRRCVVQVGN